MGYVQFSLATCLAEKRTGWSGRSTLADRGTIPIPEDRSRGEGTAPLPPTPARDDEFAGRMREAHFEPLLEVTLPRSLEPAALENRIQAVAKELGVDASLHPADADVL